MGYRVHGLYVVDFTKPEFAWDSRVLMADSFESAFLGGVQAQFIDRVLFDLAGQKGLVRIYARHGRIDLRPDQEGQLLPQPKLARFEIDFQLDGAALKVTPETAAAGRLFAVE